MCFDHGTGEEGPGGVSEMMRGCCILLLDLLNCCFACDDWTAYNVHELDRFFVIVIVVLNIVTAFLLDDFTVMRAQLTDDESGTVPEW